MKKRILLIVLSTVFICVIKAQENRKYWQEGKLTWQDFKVQNNKNGACELKFIIGFKTGKHRYGDTTVVGTETYCCSDRDLSWVHPDYKTEQYLRYNQVIFDIVEVQRRKLQYETTSLASKKFDDRFIEVYNACISEIEKFRHASKSGQNSDTIIAWEKSLSERLGIKFIEKKPEFSKRNFGYGFHAGLGKSVYTGTMGKYFKTKTSLTFGFDLAFRSSIFFFNGIVAGGEVMETYLSEKNWYKGQEANIALTNVMYGYAIIDKSKLKLSPFAGLAITGLYGDNYDDLDNPINKIDYNIAFGLNTDFKIGRRIKAFGAKEFTENSIRARLYINRENFYTDVQGYSVNFSLGFSIFGKRIRLKEQSSAAVKSL